MKQLALLPDPGTVAIAELAEACRSVYDRRNELIGSLSIDHAIEFQRQSAAIETYLRGTEAYPDAQRAARVLEMAVGKALGKARPSRHGAPALSTDKAQSEQLRHQFRQLSEGRERIEPFLADDGLSREAALRIAQGLARAYSSDDDEWYSPAPFVEAARAAMGGIDLDPCSSAIANDVVKADRFFDREQDGLVQMWAGRVWMNPPYDRKTCGLFVDKLCEEVAAGSVTEACVLLNNITETVFFQRMAGIATAMCFPLGRIPFWHPEKVNSPIQGQVIVYIGPGLRAFADEFKPFGFLVAVL